MIQIEHIRFRYPAERFELQIPALGINDRKPAAVVGPSGCGKTTLLRLIAGILRPGEGSIRVLDEEVSSLSETKARAFRIRNIGLVFQEFELLDYLTAAENMLLPFRVSNALTLTAEVRDRVRQLAEGSGIAHLLGSYPRHLSQGERQRVAICRALITQPKLLLADEPTGSLDPDNQERIVNLLLESAESAGAGFLMVTHDHQLLGHFDRVIELPQFISNPT